MSDRRRRANKRDEPTTTKGLTLAVLASGASGRRLTLDVVAPGGDGTLAVRVGSGSADEHDRLREDEEGRREPHGERRGEGG